MTGRFDPGELGGPANPWGTTVLLSLGLHLFGFILAFGLPRLMPRPAITPVYIVDLVSLPGGPAAASPPPAAPVEAAKPSLPPVPKEEKAIPIPDRNRKPEPKKTPVPKSTPARPRPTATPPTAPEPAAKTATQAENPPQTQGTPAHGASMSGVSGGAGGPGGGFGGSGAAQADLIQIYGNLIQRGVYGAWRKPIYPPGETRPALNATFLLTLASSGRVSNIVLSTSSGYETVDRSFMMAIQDAIFPPLPQGLGPTFTFQIEFTFTRD
jgi:TonB family protein